MTQPEDRLITPQITSNDAPDYALRPKYLTDMIGQDNLRAKLQILVDAAKQRGDALDHVLLYGPPGLGKALPVDSLVLTPTGYACIGDLHIGDKVIGANGKTTTVIGVFPQGERPIYKLTFSDNTYALCDKDHLWAVKRRSKRWRKQFVSIATTEIAKNLRHDNSWEFWIPMVAPIEFAEKSLPLDPYLLGSLLGNGTLCHGTPVLTTADRELLEIVEPMLPPGVMLRAQKQSDKVRYDYRLTTGSNQKTYPHNPLTVILRELKLMNTKSATKFIPDSYKFSTIENRIALLQGLLDTDGYANPKDNNIEYCTVSQQLAKDVAFLVQSLGGTARIRTKPTYRQLAYRMSVILPNSIEPFRVHRKANAHHPRTKYFPKRFIVACEAAGNANTVCIAVDAPDHCYVIEHAIVTHNTSTALALANEMSVNIKSTSGPAIERAGDLAAILAGMQSGDVLFIDEIHRLNRTVEEILYPAMEDFQLQLVVGSGSDTKTLVVRLPKFTVIGATTRLALLSSPLRARFGVVERFDFYTQDAIKRIILRAAVLMATQLTEDGAQVIATRARGTPRVALRLLRRLRDFAQVRADGSITATVAEQAMLLLGIDSLGLDELDHRVLDTLINKFNGNPVGLATLAAAISEEADTIMDVVEPYLLQLGFLERTPRGRLPTQTARDHFDALEKSNP